MSNIPKARELLDHALVVRFMPDDLREDLLAVRELLFREKAITRAPRSTGRLTADVKDEILRLKTEHPLMSYEDIATAVNQNIGRVSETLTGKRGRRWRYRGW